MAARALDILNAQVVTIAAAATLIVDANTVRRVIEVQNLSTTHIWLGNANVAVGGPGYRLKGEDGRVVMLTFSGKLYGIVAAGTADLNYIELKDA